MGTHPNSTANFQDLLGLTDLEEVLASMLFSVQFINDVISNLESLNLSDSNPVNVNPRRAFMLYGKKVKSELVKQACLFVMENLTQGGGKRG